MEIYKKILILTMLIYPVSALSISYDCRGNIPDYWEFGIAVERTNELALKNEEAKQSDTIISPLIYKRFSGINISKNCDWVGQVEIAAGTQEYKDLDELEENIIALNLGLYYTFIRLDDDDNTPLPYNPDLPLYNAFGLNIIPNYISSDNKSIETDLIYTVRIPTNIKNLFSKSSAILETDLDFSIGRRIDLVDSENNEHDDAWVFRSFVELEVITDYLDTFSPSKSFGLNIEHENNLSIDEHATDYQLFLRQRWPGILKGELGIEPYVSSTNSSNSDSQDSIGVRLTLRW